MSQTLFLLTKLYPTVIQYSDVRVCQAHKGPAYPQPPSSRKGATPVRSLYWPFPLGSQDEVPNCRRQRLEPLRAVAMQ
jgi:hypothetical protein